MSSVGLRSSKGPWPNPSPRLGSWLKCKNAGLHLPRRSAGRCLPCTLEAGEARIVLIEPAADFHQQAGSPRLSYDRGRVLCEGICLSGGDRLLGKRSGPDALARGALLVAASMLYTAASGSRHRGEMWRFRALTDRDGGMKQLWSELQGAKWVRKEADLRKSSVEKLGLPAQKCHALPGMAQPRCFHAS